MLSRPSEARARFVLRAPLGRYNIIRLDSGNSGIDPNLHVEAVELGRPHAARKPAPVLKFDDSPPLGNSCGFHNASIPPAIGIGLDRTHDGRFLVPTCQILTSSRTS